MLEHATLMLGSINAHLSIFITWFFAVAFLYNLTISINVKNRSVMFLSLIMLLSYTLTLIIGKAQLMITTSFYLDFALSDVVAIFAIVTFSHFYKAPYPIAYYYLILGLSLNAMLFLVMHYDYAVLANYDYWWGWGLYAIGQVSSDIIMALVLIINKDILGLVKLKNVVLNRKTPFAR